MRLLVTAILLLTAAFPCLAQPGWVAQTSPVAGNLDAVDFVTPQVGWICGEGGVILHTTDGGDHWIEQQSGTSRHLMGISFADSQVGVAAGEDQIVLRTTDGGASWETVRAPAQDVFPFRGVHASDAQHMWLPTEVEEPDFGAAFVSWSTNGGAGWNDREVACTDLPHTCTNAFSAIFAVDSQLIFAAGTRLTWDGLLFGVIYRTADGGASWDEFANWYGVACTDVQFVSPTVGFAECGGLAKTWDGGAGWIWRDDGGPASRLAFLDGTRGWVCGAAGYVASTTDGGNSWAVQNSGTSADLRGIDMFDASFGTIVGTGGTILHTATGGGETAGAPIREPDAAPGRAALLPSAPNPFSSEVLLSYSLPEAGEAGLSVYDAAGRFLRNLVRGPVSAGSHGVVWDGRNEAGRTVAPGVYFVRLTGSRGECARQVVVRR